VAPRPGPAPQGRLEDYRSKRDFAVSGEPQAAGRTHRGAPRFVIQEHHARRLHWDLRLERDGVLVSWAIPKGLPQAPGENHFAAATEDHPLSYLDFQGEIPKGQYGAGTVTISDSGTYECLKWEPRKVEVALHGSRIDARYALFAISPAQDPGEWLIHRMDPPTDPGREAMPEDLTPMLARSGALPSEPGAFAYEIKWDGLRAIAYSQPGRLRLHSRNLNDITTQYPELSRLRDALGAHSAVLDGEIVAFDEHARPSFAALQRRMHVANPAQARRLAGSVPLTYVIFDLLWLDGHSLMALPYAERRRRLAALALAGESWQTPENLHGDARQVLAASAAQGLEGIIAKRLDSPYEPGRRSAGWVKVKNQRRQEFVIGGWMAGQGRRSERIGALLLGVYDGAELRYAGRVGSGFSEHELDRLDGLRAARQRRSSPFAPGAAAPPRGARFCEPELVAEVEFTEWTAAGSLRHPSYKGLRDDKPAAQVVREDEQRGALEHEQSSALALPEGTPAAATVVIEGRELKLSNLAKVLYPRTGFTKREVIEYYAAVAPVLLGHLRGRALTVKRWPDGVEGHSFFQKHAPAHTPEWVARVTLDSGRGPIEHVLVKNLATLVWLANLAALELHTPLARAETPDCPTVLVFDLDPGEPASVLECARVALTLHGMFENLGLQSFVKTSGAKGLQVYLPLNRPELRFEATKAFAKAVAELLAAAEPDLVVARMTKARRAGKVLIDWSQNDRRKTTVCVYSLRAGERPSVSTPLSWEEIRAALDSGERAALSFSPAQVLERVAERGDLLAPLLSLAQQLPSL